MGDDIKCGECGSPMRLLESRKFGKFYGCTRWPDCKGTHGAHQKTGKPLGIPANADTKKMRILAHEAFDTLWKEGDMKRKDAYKWMQETLSLSSEDAHISKFDIETCELLISAIEKRK
jgi:ssDNA-binding Zn-finger/Zn-ribbon topoisomerase 1